MRLTGDRLDLLAGEFVLGTLTGPARRRFARAIESTAEVRDAVEAWERRLAPLSLRLAPVAPSAETWPRVVARLGHGATPAKSNLRWAAIAAALVLAMGTFLWIGQQRSTPPYLTAQIASAEGQGLWGLEAPRDHARLTVRALGASRPPANRSYEIWAVPAEGSGLPVVSLGLLPTDERGELVLTPGQRQALATAAQIAISDEPLGGSPTGTATGPILFVTPVMRG